MFDIICEFSRTHCVAICAVLVPLNLLTTLQTLILTAMRQPQFQVRLSAAIASLCGVVMVLHVFTWFLVGVVMAPTYILLCLASICLGINCWAIAHSSSRVHIFRRT